MAELTLPNVGAALLLAFGVSWYISHAESEEGEVELHGPPLFFFSVVLSTFTLLSLSML
eukprot:SAG11_NODE_103_length_16571_cov_49.569208_20_plen_59_part_00